MIFNTPSTGCFKVQIVEQSQILLLILRADTNSFIYRKLRTV